MTSKDVKRDNIVLLIVEDEFLISLELQAVMEDFGYTVRSVANGADAISELGLPAHDIDGLITDKRMEPGPSGWDVARRAREVYPGLPVVCMSGDSGHAHTSRGVPGSIMIQKPFAFAQILIAISTLLSEPKLAI